MADTRKKVTVKDVAAAAGVSLATASRVLGGNENVDPEMTQRVLAAKEKLGYEANFLARALRTNQTSTVGLVVPSISNPFFVSAIQALEGAFNRVGYRVLLCDSHADPKEESARVNQLIQHMVDGLVMIPVVSEGPDPLLIEVSRQKPVILFDRITTMDYVDHVGTDDSFGTQMVMDHLVRQGAKRFAFVGAKPLTNTARDRLGTYRRFVEDHGLVNCGEFLDDYTAEHGAAAAQQITLMRADVDAVVASADIIAIALLNRLTQLGVSVPGDIKLVGYDDLWVSRVMTPALTSVRQPLEDMAATVVEFFLSRRVDLGQPARKRVFKPTLIVRESSSARVAQPDVAFD